MKSLGQKMGGEVNSGGPQIPMPGKAKALALPAPKPRAAARPTFVLDNVVRHLQQFPFLDSTGENPHPLANLMGWQYLMGGRRQQDPEDTKVDAEQEKLCLQYAFWVAKGNDPKTEFIERRKATPEVAVNNYWDLYEDFIFPDGNRLIAWHTDLLDHVLTINQLYAKQFTDEEREGIDLFKHEVLMQCLSRNFAHSFNMDESSSNFDLLQAAYKRGGGGTDGLKVVILAWLNKFGFLPTAEDPYDERTARFCMRVRQPGGQGSTHSSGSVIDFCSRVITQFAHVFLHKNKTLKRGGKQVTKAYRQAGLVHNMQCFPFWGLIGFRPPNLGQLQGKITLTNSFWGEKNCTKIWQNHGAFPEEQQRLQRLFIYSGVDETKGMRVLHEWAANRQRDTTKPPAYNMSGMHISAFTYESGVPWRLVSEGRAAVGAWPPDSCTMEVSNYQIVLDVLKSLEGRDVPGKKTRAPKRGREEPGAQAVTISRPQKGNPIHGGWPAMPPLGPLTVTENTTELVEYRDFHELGDPVPPAFPTQYERPFGGSKRARIDNQPATPGEEEEGSTILYVGFGLLVLASVIHVTN